MIPLPRPRLLTGAVLVGAAFGVLAAIAGQLAFDSPIRRPDVVMLLALGVPTVVGLGLVLFSRRRWSTAAGAFVVAVAPAWFAVLLATQLVTHA